MPIKRINSDAVNCINDLGGKNFPPVLGMYDIMLKREVLEMCENAIRKNMGSLYDLPYELANTVANVYYRYFQHAIELMRQSADNRGWIPKEREKDMWAGLSSFLDDTARLNSDFEAVPKFIEGLRRIDKHSQPKLYQFTVDFILDCLKYDIKRAHEKTGLRRMIERRFRRVKVREIPNLVDFLKI